MRRTLHVKSCMLSCLLALGSLIGATAMADDKDTTYIFPPAPGHENLPVVFWAHYMPQVANGLLHAGGHVGGNADVFPFQTTDADRINEMVSHMKNALASGINGFQYLTVVFPESVKAAEKVKKETGQMFYVAPEWCGMGNDYKKAADRIAKFAEAYKDNPHILKVKGRQLHFLYNQGGWSGAGGWHGSSNVPKVQEILKSKGLEVMLVPTVGSAVAVALDRADLMHRTKEPFVPIEPHPLKWMKETNWDGATSLNGSANARSSSIAEIRDRLGKLDRDFLFVPALRTMYDSSNRYWQAIHCRGMGIRMLRRDLKRWTEAGFRQFTFSTWNDVNETMLMPSSRNPWGYNDLIKYYHSIAATGKSPFAEPHFVVSFEPEVLLGDQGFFQCLLLPEAKMNSCDYAVSVTMKSITGKDVLAFGTMLQSNNERWDDLSEVRFETSQVKDDLRVLVPYITIRKIDSSSGVSKMIYENLRLPPIRIRYNKLHFYTPYSISLNHVNPKTDVALKVNDQQGELVKGKLGDLLTFDCTVKDAGAPIRRLNLSESCLPVGAFRGDDTRELVGGEKRRVHLRMKASKEMKINLNVTGGVIDEDYLPHWNIKKALKVVGKPEAEVAVPSWGKSTLPKVCRISCPVDSEITLSVPGSDKPFVTTTVAQLAKGTIYAHGDEKGKPFDLTLQLTTDVTDQNVNYPVKEGVDYVRTFPLVKGFQPLRVFHSWSLMENDTIAYSAPVVVLVEDAASSKVLASTHKANYIQTKGVFDDFVNDSHSAPANPFLRDDVVSAELPFWMIPYFKLDLNEGVGVEVNTSGTAHQLGRAWLSGKREWIKDGWEGSAVKLDGGQIKFRSKTMPHGSYTLSMRVKAAKGKLQSVFEDADYYMDIHSGPVDLRLLPDGKVRAARYTPQGEDVVISTNPISDGWNHIVVTYDLTSMSLYLNGKRESQVPVDVPTYQRTHSTPAVGFSKVVKNKTKEDVGFSGEIDQIEIFGVGLSDAEVKALYNKKN